MIIPIGLQCTVGAFKQEFENSETLPFDWMFAHPKFVYEMLVLLLEKNIEISELVRAHFFNCSKYTKFMSCEHHVTCDTIEIPYNTIYDVIFPHDVCNEETIAKYIRRFERLKILILRSSEKLNFVYISQSSNGAGNFTIDGRCVVNNVYENLNKINELIGRFRNNYKVFVFDTLQEENTELLNPNICLVKLEARDNWSALMPQLRNYRYFF